MNINILYNIITLHYTLLIFQFSTLKINYLLTRKLAVFFLNTKNDDIF